MNNFKKGDIVTQNDIFFDFFNAERFSLKIIKIEGKVIYLENFFLIESKLEKFGKFRTNQLNEYWLKNDIKEIRKNKLKKIEKTY